MSTCRECARRVPTGEEGVGSARRIELAPLGNVIDLAYERSAALRGQSLVRCTKGFGGGDAPKMPRRMGLSGWLPSCCRNSSGV